MQVHDFFVVAAQIIPVFLLAILLEYRRITAHETVDPPKRGWRRFRKWSRQFFRQIVLGMAFFGEMFAVSMILLPEDVTFDGLDSVPLGLLFAVDFVAVTIFVVMQAAINSVFFGTGRKRSSGSTNTPLTSAVPETKQVPANGLLVASLIASSLTLIASAIWHRRDNISGRE
jgi:hypothetical protein